VPAIPQYNELIADTARTEAYSEALRRAVKQDSVVVDIGTGTGIMALLACRFGARRVYAIEPSDAIEVAKKIAAQNGYADRIEFIKEISTRVTLPERGDVVVSDLRGVLPWYGGHIPDVIDARERFLADEGVLIPQRDVAWAALVEAPEHYHTFIGVCSDDFLGLDMTAALRFAANSIGKVQLAPHQLLVEPRPWTTLEYGTVKSPDSSGELAWTVIRRGTAHGLGVWFDARLLEGVGFSNGPDRQETVYGQAFFPLTAPVVVAPNERVAADIRARFVVDHYVWRWRTRFGADLAHGEAQTGFDQSTLLAEPVPASRIDRGQADHRPALDGDGEIDRFVLSLMDGQTELWAIAHRVAERYPDGFPTSDAALRRVIGLSQRYSR
jgi:protein arginine N-methyltransferase 1